MSSQANKQQQDLDDNLEYDANSSDLNEPADQESDMDQEEEEEEERNEEDYNQLKTDVNNPKESDNESENDNLEGKNGNLTPPFKQSISSKNSRKSSQNYLNSNSDTLNLKYYKSFQDDVLYPIQANSFFKLESLLFDALGFKNQPPTQEYLKKTQQQQQQQSTPADEQDYRIQNDLNDLDKLNQLENGLVTCSFINDMNMLNERLKFNDLSSKFGSYFDKINLKSAKTNTTAKSTVSTAGNVEYKRILIDYERQREKFRNKAKLVTVVLNEPNVRPRKSGKILVCKRNLNNFDTILNEISNLFRIDYTSVKRLYDLNGIQITDSKDLLDNQIIFLFVGNEKIYGKDFDLDPLEIELFFANQPEYKRMYLESMETSEQETTESRAKQQSKIGIERRITSTDNAMNLLPQELLDNYEVGHVIGQGHYALVRECKDINTGIQFALKIIDLKNISENDKSIENELKILRKVKHTNIVKLVEEYRTNRFIYLIMEYLKDGDLLEAITLSKKYNEKESAGMIRNIACALSYLHSLNIVHRDVKLENILIHKYSDGSAILKLGDFGLAIELDGELNEKCGSPIYVAPEVLEKKNYGLEVDVWSLGIICYILLCGFAPFQGSNEKETFDAILREQLKFPSPYWDQISPEAIDLIKKMLDRNQSTRISIDQVLEHVWINSNTSLTYIANNTLSSTMPTKNDTNNQSTFNQNESTPRYSDTQTDKIMSKHSNKNYKPTKNVLAPL